LVRKFKCIGYKVAGSKKMSTFASPLTMTAIVKTPVKDRCKYDMAKDNKGRKFNRIPEYVRKQNGKTVYVKAHARSNRSDCKGRL
jgi:hypothetical protein